MKNIARQKRLGKIARPAIVLTTPQLRTLCDQAEALRFSNGPNDKFWKQVDPNGFHVVELWFVHQPCLAFWEGVQHEWNFSHGGGKNIRALVLCKMLGRIKPCVLKCDFDHDAFMALPRIVVKARRSPRNKKAAA